MFIGSSTASKVDAAVSKLQASYPSGTVAGRAVDMKDEASVHAFIAWTAATGNKGIDHLSTLVLRPHRVLPHLSRAEPLSASVYSAGDSLTLGPLSQTDTSSLGDVFDVRVFGIFR